MDTGRVPPIPVGSAPNGVSSDPTYGSPPSATSAPNHSSAGATSAPSTAYGCRFVRSRPRNASAGRVAPGANAMSIGPPAQWIAPLPSARTTTRAPASASRIAVARPARPAPMTATSALGIVAAGARPDQAVEPERPPVQARGDHRLLELATVRDRQGAALALADEVGHRRLHGVADRDRVACDACRVVRHRASRTERAEAALARAHAQPRRPANVVQAARPAPVEDVAEHRARYQLAFAHQVDITATAHLVHHEPPTEPVVARR